MKNDSTKDNPEIRGYEFKGFAKAISIVFWTVVTIIIGLLIYFICTNKPNAHKNIAKTKITYYENAKEELLNKYLSTWDQYDSITKVNCLNTLYRYQDSINYYSNK